MQTISLTPEYRISRLIKGGWHLAGGHGPVDTQQALVDMAQFVESGITTFDCADIYTGVEQMIGDFRLNYPALATKLKVHTKFVPDLDRLGSVDSQYVEQIIHRSMKRLGVDQLDLVQFHWWDFTVPGYVEAALELSRLQKIGDICHLGVTNFDVAHLRELHQAGVAIVAHQLQYSVLDSRPSGLMTEYCAAAGIGFLCYGTVAGGFLSERWLGVAEPAHPLANRSLTKYKLIIDDFGGWARFQDLLRVLKQIAENHQCDIATIASAYVLAQPQVSAAIIGATNTAHLPSHLRLANVALDSSEIIRIRDFLATGPHLAGDVYELERDRDGRHGRIMKYNLSTPT